MTWWWWTLSFISSGKHFICPSILNDSFAGWSNLICRSFLFIIEYSLPAKFFLRNHLTVLRELLTFEILIMMCLGVVLSVSILFGALWASWTCMPISFTKVGKFSFIIFSNKFSISCFLFSFQHCYDFNVGTFEVVPEATYPILVFLNSFFFLLFWLNFFFFLVF